MPPPPPPPPQPPHARAAAAGDGGEEGRFPQAELALLSSDEIFRLASQNPTAGPGPAVPADLRAWHATQPGGLATAAGPAFRLWLQAAAAVTTTTVEASAWALEGEVGDGLVPAAAARAALRESDAGDEARAM